MKADALSLLKSCPVSSDAKTEYTAREIYALPNKISYEDVGVRVAVAEVDPVTVDAGVALK